LCTPIPLFFFFFFWASRARFLILSRGSVYTLFDSCVLIMDTLFARRPSTVVEFVISSESSCGFCADRGG